VDGSGRFSTSLNIGSR